MRQSPADGGRLELIVRRPAVGERDILADAQVTRAEGLVGDGWRVRGSSSTPDGSADPEEQVTLMSSRAVSLVAGDDPQRWALAGDQLYVDLDISLENLPAGSRLRIGSAVLEVSRKPHTGCKKFAARFGMDAARFVNSPVGRSHRLRGMNARVVTAGRVAVGDVVAVERALFAKTAEAAAAAETAAAAAAAAAAEAQPAAGSGEPGSTTSTLGVPAR